MLSHPKLMLTLSQLKKLIKFSPIGQCCRNTRNVVYFSCIMQEFIKHAKNRLCLVLRIKLFWIGYNYHKTRKTIFEPFDVKGMGIEDKKIGIELNLSKIFAPLYTIILEDVTFTKFAYWLIDWLKCCFHDREIVSLFAKCKNLQFHWKRRSAPSNLSASSIDTLDLSKF